MSAAVNEERRNARRETDSVTPTGRIQLDATSGRISGYLPNIDVTMESAAAFAGSQAIGVVLTGMGNDGAHAMARLHAEGGRTIAEAEETAVVWGMPGELVAANGADWVLPLPEIAGWLRKLAP